MATTEMTHPPLYNNRRTAGRGEKDLRRPEFGLFLPSCTRAQVQPSVASRYRYGHLFKHGVPVCTTAVIVWKRIPSKTDSAPPTERHTF